MSKRSKKGLEVAYTGKGKKGPSPKIDFEKLRSTLNLSMAIAHADCELVVEEIETVCAQLKKMNVELLDSKERNELELLLADLEKNPPNPYTEATKLAKKFSPNEKSKLLEQLFNVSKADGIFDEQEEKMLYEIHRIIGTEQLLFSNLCREAKRSCRYRKTSNNTQTVEQSVVAEHCTSGSDSSIVDEFLSRLRTINKVKRMNELIIRMSRRG